jgi:hypothetical protein
MVVCHMLQLHNPYSAPTITKGTSESQTVAVHID